MLFRSVPVEKGNQVIESNNFNEGTTIAAVADVEKMIFEEIGRASCRERV